MLTALPNEQLQWFNDARFGVFFHWGIYAVHARGEWAYVSEQYPPDAYARLAWEFKPRVGWADTWMDLVTASGARYAVMTTKHHDGYCLFETATSAFSAPRTGPGRDLVREYVDACRRAGVKVGLYYSPPDWRWSFTPLTPSDAAYAAYRDYVHTQVHELCTHYGPIDLWWWDGTPPEGEALMAWMRQAQPTMVINDRGGIALDCASCEKEIRPPKDLSRPWECCTTSNQHWGYFGAGDIRWMSTADVVHWLTCVAASGGNLLLNIGPTASGAIPAKAQRLFREVGEWLKVHGESIYGTGRSSISGGAVGCTTARGNTAYVHILHYYAPELVVLSPQVRVQSARLLATGQPLQVRQEGARVILSGLPRRAPDRRDTVVVLDTDGSAEA